MRSEPPSVILALDTSTRIQALGLVVDGQLLARRHHVVKTNHAATLLRNIDDILTQHTLRVPDLELVAVGRGPGTFTGLRVGLANAKSLARAAEAPIVGVSSLAALARPVSDLFHGVIVPVFDARRGEVYSASYRSTDAGIEPLHAPCTLEPCELRQQILELAQHQPVRLVGPGLRAFPDELLTWGSPSVRSLASGWDSPSPYSIAMLGLQRWQTEGPDDRIALEPEYIRLSDAEISWNARNTAPETSS